jgi:GT2 family glycosyltransferase
MRVGVILAARAPAPWLAEALDSVLSQQPAPAEVVLVDHASPRPLEGSAGVRVVRLESPDGGPAAARQAGLDVLGAGCDWVALADADDVWESGKLAAQVAAVEAHPDVAVCAGRAVVIDAGGRVTAEELPSLAAGVHSAESLREPLYRANRIAAASALVRRSDLVAVGGFTPSVPLEAATDWDLWLRLVAAGATFLSVPEARIRYRRHAGGVTSNLTRLARAGLQIHERHADLVDAEAQRTARAADLEALARGLIRERKYADARARLAEAGALRPLAARERCLAVATTVPILRGALGRRSPYA